MSHAYPRRPHRAAFAALLLCGVFGDTLADDGLDTAAPVWLEWPAAPDLTAVRTHIVAPLVSDTHTNTELAGVSYRWWLTHGRADLGLGLGALGHVVDSPTIGGGASLVGSVPTLTVGVRYRLSSESALFADASGAHGLGGDGRPGYVNTKLGMEWTSAKPKFGFEQGALGVHFDSGYAVTLRARHGGIGAYLRGKF